MARLSQGLAADQHIGLGTRLALIMTPWLTALALAGLTPVLPLISADFSATPGGASLTRTLVTIIGGAAIIGAPSAGLLAGRIGSYRVLTWALVLFAASGAAGFLLEDLWLLLASRLILGLAVGAISVTGVAMITTAIEPEGRNRWLGYYTVSGTMGAFVILPLSAAIGRMDWHAVFLLHLIAVPIVLVLAMNPPPPAAVEDDAALPGKPKGAFPFLWTLIGVGCGIASGSLGVYVPFHLAEIGVVRPEQVALALIPLNILMGVSAAFYGLIRKRFQIVGVFVACFIIGSVRHRGYRDGPRRQHGCHWHSRLRDRHGPDDAQSVWRRRGGGIAR